MPLIYLVVAVYVFIIIQNIASVSASSLRNYRTTEEGSYKVKNSTRQLVPFLNAQTAYKQNRVVGGRNADPGSFPSFVHWDWGCGGSLIHEDIVLSAAHCYHLGGRNNDQVFVGSNRFQDGVERTITEYVPHPQYERKYERNDFLILKLDSSVEDVKPITLNRDKGIPSINDRLTVVGFGKTYATSNPNVLQQANVDLIPFDRCVMSMREAVDDMNICAGGGGRDACMGDSGGPLYSTSSDGQEQQQVGIVSWGKGCGISYYPGIYSRVSYAYGWIKNKICMHSANPPSECVPITVHFENYSNNHARVIQLQITDIDNVHIMYESLAFNLQESPQITTILMPGKYLLNINDFSGHPSIARSYSVFRGEGADLELLSYGIPKDNVAVSFDVLDYHRQQQQQQLTKQNDQQWQQQQLRQHQPIKERKEQPTLSISTPGNDQSTTVAISIEFLFDHYSDEISWSLLDISNEKLLGNANTGDYLWIEYGRRTTQEIFTIQKGDIYRFTISDSAGDGLCCLYSSGYFAVKVGEKVIFTGDEFGSTESIEFTVS